MHTRSNTYCRHTCTDNTHLTHTSLLCANCCVTNRPKPENLHSLSEFYEAMYDEDGLAFYDAPGALPLSIFLLGADGPLPQG